MRCGEWRQFLSTLICLCFEVAEVVSPIVSHSSPEGNVPAEVKLGQYAEESRSYTIHLLILGIHFPVCFYFIFESILISSIS